MRITLEIPEKEFKRYDQYYRPWITKPEPCPRCGAELVTPEPYCPNIACENLR